MLDIQLKIIRDKRRCRNLFSVWLNQVNIFESTSYKIALKLFTKLTQACYISGFANTSRNYVLDPEIYNEDDIVVIS